MPPFNNISLERAKNRPILLFYDYYYFYHFKSKLIYVYVNVQILCENVCACINVGECVCVCLCLAHLLALFYVQLMHISQTLVIYKGVGTPTIATYFMMVHTAHCLYTCIDQDQQFLFINS